MNNDYCRNTYNKFKKAQKSFIDFKVQEKEKYINYVIQLDDYNIWEKSYDDINDIYEFNKSILHHIGRLTRMLNKMRNHLQNGEMAEQVFLEM